MEKVKITVIRRTIIEDLLKEYGNPDLGLCSRHREGQVFYCSDGWQKPDGLCDNAWKSMMEYVMTLAHGEKLTAAGSRTRMLRLLAAMMGCVRSSLKLSLRVKLTWIVL